MSPKKGEAPDGIGPRVGGFMHNETQGGPEMPSNDTTTSPSAAMPGIGAFDHRVLAELAARGRRGLTHPEFQAIYGSWRLAAGVHSLRRRGWRIVGSWETNPSTLRPWKRYFLGGGQHD